MGSELPYWQSRETLRESQFPQNIQTSLTCQMVFVCPKFEQALDARVLKWSNRRVLAKHVLAGSNPAPGS